MSEAPGARQDAAGEDRVGRAFSLRRNLRALLVPSPGHLRPLDGLRALSILWVMLFHAGWYAIGSLPTAGYVRLLKARWMIPFWRGDFGVDVFFVLSGFLIAGLLIDERARTGRLALGLFYGRRLMRLWPALLAALLLDVALVEKHPDATWATALYVSNFLPIGEAAMGWTWSLAIEEQFYLVCPWLVGGVATLGGRARAGVLGGLAIGLCVLGTAIAWAGGFRAGDMEVVINRPLEPWARAFDALYDKPWMRAGPLLTGVAAAYVLRAKGAMDALGRARALPVVALVAALGVAGVVTHWQLFEGLPPAAQAVFVGASRTAFGAAVAYVLLLSLSAHPVGRLLGRALSARALHPVAQLAYAAYLLNPIVTQLLYGALGPRVPSGGPETYALLAPLSIAGTLAAAAALHLAVERPLMELRPRAAA